MASDNIIETVAILATLQRDAECREGVPEKDRVHPRVIAGHAVRLRKLARKFHTLQIHEMSEGAGDGQLTERRRQKVLAEANSIATFFDCKLVVGGDVRGFPFMLQRVGLPSNCFSGENDRWGIAP